MASSHRRWLSVAKTLDVCLTADGIGTRTQDTIGSSQKLIKEQLYCARLRTVFVYSFGLTQLLYPEGKPLLDGLPVVYMTSATALFWPQNMLLQSVL